MKPILQILVLLAVYLLTGTTTNAQTITKDTIDGIVYDVFRDYPFGFYDNYAVVISNQDTNLTGAITIVNSVDGLPVINIDYNAFRQCSRITSVSIPSTVTYFNPFAFAYCTSLETINIPEGIDCLEYTFAGCKSLKNLVLPNQGQRI